MNIISKMKLIQVIEQYAFISIAIFKMILSFHIIPFNSTILCKNKSLEEIWKFLMYWKRNFAQDYTDLYIKKLINLNN